MAIKIYLSPAAHESDNPCLVAGCSENTHANLYLDELTPYLDACGIAWKRNGKQNVGRMGVQKAVRASNEWGADLHYVVHTNAANGQAQGSRPHVYPTGDGKAWAEKIIARRKEIYPYPCIIKTNSDLYEIVNTRAVCVYEELVFHDNIEDVRWFHEHMRELAEATVKAFCDIFKME
jgi:N-acetylmuramoyl-L-alanine amidase